MILWNHGGKKKFPPSFKKCYHGKPNIGANVNMGIGAVE